MGHYAELGCTEMECKLSTLASCEVHHVDFPFRISHNYPVLFFSLLCVCVCACASFTVVAVSN